MLNEDANSQIPIGFKLRHTLQRNKKSINSVAWSPDGEIFVCGSDEFNLLFWDAQVVKQWGKLFDEESFEESSEDLGDVRFICVAWSPDSQTLASAFGLTLVLANLEGDVFQVLEGHSHYISSLAWSPDGRTLASTSNDRTKRANYNLYC